MPPKHIKLFPSLTIVAVLLSSCFSGGTSSTSDGAAWPQWSGPNRNFTSAEKGYDPQAFTNGVNVLWETDVGFGTSSASISNGRLYTLGERERISFAYSINPKNGKIRWERPIQRSPTPSFGVHATPAVDGDRLYTFTLSGDVHCLETRSGETIWNVNLVDQYGMRVNYRPDSYRHVPPILSSPIVAGEALIIHGNTVLVALDKMTGDELWHHKDDHARPGQQIMSTPFPMTIGGTTYLIRQGHGRLEAFLMATGTLIASVNIPRLGLLGNNEDDGIVDGTRIIIGGHGLRSEMFSFNGRKFSSDWTSDDFSIGGSPFVLVDDYLYGFTMGQSELLKAFVFAGFVCINASSGREMWRVKMPEGPYTSALAYGGVTFVDNIFYMLTNKGTLIAAGLSPAGYTEFSRGDLPDSPQRRYVAPAVISGGRLYAKSTSGKLCCIDIGAH